MSQRFAPSGLTGILLGTVGISLFPGERGITYPGGKPSACCFSIDFDVTKESRRVPNRRGTKLILGLTEKLEIPVTWAICGKTAEEEPVLLDAIRNSSQSHEIACHTYSHLRVDAASPDELEQDTMKWRSAVPAVPKTFIFPYNKQGNFETLGRLGFTTFRGEGRRVSPPYPENGFCNVPAVMYLSGSSEGTYRRARQFIDLCIRYRSVFHMWSHPWNLSREGDAGDFANSVLSPILSYIKRREQEGDLGISTMDGLSKFGRANRDRAV